VFCNETKPLLIVKSSESNEAIPFTALTWLPAVAKSILDCVIVKLPSVGPEFADIATSAIMKSPILTCSPMKTPSAVTVYASPLSIAMFDAPYKAGEFALASYPPL